MQKQVCSRCKNEKSFSEFFKDSNTRLGVSKQCKACILERHKMIRLGLVPKGEKAGVPARPVGERFWLKVNKSDGCWNWAGCKSTAGYGKILFNKKSDYAHRVSWVIHFGPIPEGMLVCHKCDNPQCVNPKHLFLGTDADNVFDMHSKQRHARGETHPILLDGSRLPRGSAHKRSKLKESQVLEIVKRVKSSSHPKLAKEFGVSDSAIRLIAIGKNWRWLTGLQNPLVESTSR